MLKVFSAIVIAAGLAAASLGTAHAQAKQDFILENATGYPLRAVYVSPASSESWDEDIMGNDIMPDGAVEEIAFSRDDTSCKWDLKVTFEDDGSDAIWQGIDLCTVSRITISYDRDSDKTMAKFD
ncbi:MAG: hypothetical protein RIB84_04140 [Sneathiellaceae bacterium]